MKDKLSVMELKTYRNCWSSGILRRIKNIFRASQKYQLFCLTCSDRDIDLGEIFSNIDACDTLIVKNIGGLFTHDAKVALIYSLTFMQPKFIIVLHHTKCSGYRSLIGDSEQEIKRYLIEHNAFHSKVRVEKYLKQHKIELSSDLVEQLIIEECCRLQLESMKNFLMLHHPKLNRKIIHRDIHVLPLIYTGNKVYYVPDKLEGSENMKRREL